MSKNLQAHKAVLGLWLGVVPASSVIAAPAAQAAPFTGPLPPPPTP